MNFNIQAFFKKHFQSLTIKKKIAYSASIVWMLIIAYLVWWNTAKGYQLDKSFLWSEWFWFGVIPAVIPYLLYFIWKEKTIDNEHLEKKDISEKKDDL
jgi:hypothetical protein